MYNTVEGLLALCKSISEISRTLGMDRKTVRKIRDKLQSGEKAPVMQKKSKLEPYREQIIDFLHNQGLSGVLIHRRLVEEFQLDVSYNSVKKYLRKLRSPGKVYVFLLSPPGTEAQVDFGYLGYFHDEVSNRKVKCWIFCMRLSYSRYDYYEVVTSAGYSHFYKVPHKCL